MRPARAIVPALLLAALLAGCETTEQKSAAIAKRLAGQTARTTTVRLGHANTTVRVDASVLVHGNGTTAAAVELTNTAATPQADLPILIDVSNAAGKSVYRNNTAGIEPSLQALSLLPAHATVWWVDDQVLATSASAAHLTVSVGRARASAPTALPAFSTHDVTSTTNFLGPLVAGTVQNSSNVAQTELALYAVAVRGGQVLAAGRGVVASLPASASAHFSISLAGNPHGAPVELTIAPPDLG
jgi:hypothetical protein